MEQYQKEMIKEHGDLIIRIQNLHNYIYSDRSNADSKVEFANKCIQLSAMKKYEEALLARIENEGFVFENGQYFKRVACLKAKDPEIKDEENGEQPQEQEQQQQSCSHCNNC